MKMIYFIQDETTLNIKIGCSISPANRLKALQTANPNKFRLIGAIPGGRNGEDVLHQKYKKWRIGGEWFNCLPDIIDELRHWSLHVFFKVFGSDKIISLADLARLTVDHKEIDILFMSEDNECEYKQHLTEYVANLSQCHVIRNKSTGYPCYLDFKYDTTKFINILDNVLTRNTNIRFVILNPISWYIEKSVIRKARNSLKRLSDRYTVDFLYSIYQQRTFDTFLVELLSN